MTTLQSPFKCVGGKAKLVDALRERMPPFDENGPTGYCEPFLGGGALYRTLAGAGVLEGLPVRLNDASPGAMRAWNDVQRNLEWTEAALAAYELAYNTKEPEARGEMYLREREVWNSGGVTGARHIFLRKLAFNGLWRENKKGGFNVPWGKYPSFNAPDLRELSRALQSVELTCDTAVNALAELPAGWLVYLDPPYHGEFAAYTSQGFKLEDQVELLQACTAATERGCTVYYSNRWCVPVRELIDNHWPQAQVDRLIRAQTMACTADARGAVEELIAWA